MNEIKDRSFASGISTAGNENFYQALLESSSDVLIVIDSQRTVVFQSGNYKNFWGRDPQREIEADLINDVHPEDMPLIHDAFSRMKRNSPNNIQLEVRARHSDGTWRNLEIIIRDLLKIPTVRGFVVNIRDITERTKVEKALRKSEEKYRSLTEHLSAGVFRNTPGSSGRFLEANPAIVSMFGYSVKEELLQRPVSSLYKEPRLRDEFNQEMLQHGIVRNKELELVKQDGTIFIGSVSVVAVKDENGEVQYYDGIIEDITNRKRKEDQLQHSFSLLNATLESTADGILVVDRSGRVSRFNQKFLDLWRIPKAIIDTNEDAKLLAFVIDQLKYPEQFLSKVEQMYAEPGMISEDILEFKDGRFFERFSQPHRLGKEIVGRVWSFSDITARRRAEQALQESEARNRAILDAMPDMMFVHDRNGVYLDFHSSTSAPLYMPPEQFLGKRIRDTFSPGFSSTLMDLTEKVITTGKLQTLEYELPIAGKSMFFEARLAPFSGNKVLSIIRDVTDRRQAEDNLINSEKRLKILFEYAPEAYYLSDLKGIFLDGNIAAEKLIGYKKNKIIGKSFYQLELLSPMQSIKAGKLLAKNKLGKPTGPDEFVLHRKDGTNATVEISTHPVKINDQTVILGIARDITERKLAEERLEESRIRFQHISSSISDISFSCMTDNGGNYRIDWIYGATEKITGYTFQELIDMKYWEKLVVENDYPLFKKHIIDVRPGSSDKCQLRLKHKNGNIIWTEVSAECVRRKNYPRKKFLFGGMVDITSTVQYIKELHDSEMKFRSLVENAFDGIYLTNGTYFTYVNKKFCEITGYSEKELTSRTFDFDILLPEKSQKVVRERTVLRKQGKLVPSLIEFELITKKGVRKKVETSTVNVSNEDEFLILGIVRDISERIKMESQVIQSSRLSALGEMAAGIAHEINQPLNTLSLAFDNILYEAQVNPLVDANYLNSKSEKINDSILRIRNIIDHVRAFSRSQEGYILAAFNINESIRNATSLVLEQYKIAGIELAIHLDETIPSIIGNTFKVEQVLLNLLSNAKDALLEKKNKSNKNYPMQVRIGSKKDQERIVVKVIDNGIGIPSENMDKVFLPFYTSKETGKGTGLGLSISYGIIQEMKGKIGIRSEVSKGTTVTITIPCLYQES